MFAALFGVGAIILFPIFYGCMAFVMTLIHGRAFQRRRKNDRRRGNRSQMKAVKVALALVFVTSASGAAQDQVRLKPDTTSAAGPHLLDRRA